MLNKELLQQALDERNALRRALEIIAVGDAQDPQAQAAEELIALGYWREIPEARLPAAPTPVVREPQDMGERWTRRQEGIARAGSDCGTRRN